MTTPDSLHRHKWRQQPAFPHTRAPLPRQSVDDQGIARRGQGAWSGTQNIKVFKEPFRPDARGRRG